MKSIYLFLTTTFLFSFFFSFANNPPQTSSVPAGKITGKVIFEGRVPTPKKIANSDKCGSITDKSLLVNRNKGLANVFIKLTSGVPKKKYTPSRSRGTIEIKNCQMSPRMNIIMIGEVVQFKNSDGILHSIKGISKSNKQFNIGMPPSARKATSPFSRAERPFQVKSDVHPWMNSYVAVMTHPYFAVSNQDGSFSIDNVPDGTYQIEAWHEKLGTRKGTVVLENGAGKINFKY